MLYSKDQHNFSAMDANQPEIDEIFTLNAYFSWGWKGCGFGQLSFYLGEDGEIMLDNECMSRERVRAILHAYADAIADRCILADKPFIGETDAS